MEVSVDIDNAKKFIYSYKFRKFLTENTTDFATACFVLQTLFDRIDEIEKGEN